MEIPSCMTHIAPSEAPLSADVIHIKTDKRSYIFDTGASDAAAEYINAVEGEKYLIISHFHPDHSSNLARIKADAIFSSKEVCRKIGMGEIVADKVVFEDAPLIYAANMPSSHSKGSTVLVCGEYALLGDGAYAANKGGRRVYNAYKLQKLIEFLEGLDARWFGMSHYKGYFYEKKTVLAMLRAVYAQRKQGEDFILADRTL